MDNIIFMHYYLFFFSIWFNKLNYSDIIRIHYIFFLQYFLVIKLRNFQSQILMKRKIFEKFLHFFIWKCYIMSVSDISQNSWNVILYIIIFDIKYSVVSFYINCLKILKFQYSKENRKLFKESQSNILNIQFWNSFLQISNIEIKIIKMRLYEN